MDTDRGIYSKFRVVRKDARDMPGEKHHGCQYFVLDLTHDKHAPAAILAYALSCKGTPLASDLFKWLASQGIAEPSKSRQAVIYMDDCGEFHYCNDRKPDWDRRCDEGSAWRTEIQTDGQMLQVVTDDNAVLQFPICEEMVNV